jgi:hypothetical protein
MKKEPIIVTIPAPTYETWKLAAASMLTSLDTPLPVIDALPRKIDGEEIYIDVSSLQDTKHDDLLWCGKDWGQRVRDNEFETPDAPMKLRILDAAHKQAMASLDPQEFEEWDGQFQRLRGYVKERNGL